MIKLKSLTLFSEAMDAERIAALGKYFDSLPKAPELSPAQSAQVLQKFKNLPSNKRKLMVKAIQRPCANCEREFNLASTGWSHGFCPRHYKELTGKSGGASVDLEQFTDEERKMLVNLFSVIKKMKMQQKKI